MKKHYAIIVLDSNNARVPKAAEAITFNQFLEIVSELEEKGCQETCIHRLICGGRCVREAHDRLNLREDQYMPLLQAVTFHFRTDLHLPREQPFKSVFDLFFNGDFSVLEGIVNNFRLCKIMADEMAKIEEGLISGDDPTAQFAKEQYEKMMETLQAFVSQLIGDEVIYAGYDERK